MREDRQRGRRRLRPGRMTASHAKREQGPLLGTTDRGNDQREVVDREAPAVGVDRVSDPFQ